MKNGSDCAMRLSSVNWKKGFNRLFLIAAIGWVLYIVPTDPWRNREKELQFYKDRYAACFQKATTLSHNDEALSGKQIAGALKRADAEVKRCQEEFKRDTWPLYRILFSWEQWRTEWPFIIGLAVVPPFVAYWLLRATALLFRWIWRGFASHRAKPAL
jgi:hypothetical protein